jgi:hypothetical protein
MLPYDTKPEKRDLVNIMVNHTMKYEPDLLLEILTDYYKQYDHEELLTFWADAGYLEIEQEKEWEFKSQQGPL